MNRNQSILAGASILSTLIVLFFLHEFSSPIKPMGQNKGTENLQAKAITRIPHHTGSVDGITQDPTNEDAIRWFRGKSQQGDCGAMWAISRFNIPNDEKAVWLKKGSELESESCILELINGYYHGDQGLPRDMGAAIFWELKRGELYLKRDRRSQLEIYLWLAKLEHKLRKDKYYDGPLRPLP